MSGAETEAASTFAERQDGATVTAITTAEPRMTKHHDTGYKELFSHPEFVQQLIEGFAP